MSNRNQVIVKRIGRVVRVLARLALGVALAAAGLSHLTTSRAEFQAQVPAWVPIDADAVVVISGVVEIIIGLWLVTGYRAPLAGCVAALFFIAIFPGNVSQWITQTDAFGLDTDSARFIRLFFQPVLVLWALWSTGAWSWLRGLKRQT
ncbi:MAG: DoxX family membrane protein [Aurantimicrobium sp.]|nr:DoxX family membrane protein [Aurantimicrobium sp.]